MIWRFDQGVRQVIARNRRLNEFPAIPVSYFDAESERYITSNTARIRVTIREAETLSGSEIVSAPSNSAVSAGALEASERGVFANDSNLSSLRNEAVRPGRWVSAWAAMIVCWGFASLGIRHVKRIREDPALLRRRSAASRARTALEDAALLVNSGNAPETCDSLRRAVTGLIADFADVPESGLTPRDAADRLRTLGIEESLCARTQELLNNCDAARYGAAKEDVPQLHKSASSLIDQLVAALKKSPGRASSAKKTPTALLLLLGLCLTGCSSTPDLEMSRMFQDAELAFARATSPDEFARVARRVSTGAAIPAAGSVPGG